MDCKTKGLLQFHPNTVGEVRALYNLDKPERLEEALNIFEEWIQKQNHFKKKDFPRRYLESLIITSKGSLERAKERIDKLCTLRTYLPDLFGDFDMRNDFKDFDKTTRAILPQLTKDNNRVIMLALNGDKLPNSFVPQVARNSIMFAEYTRFYDYSDGYIFVVDLVDVNIAELISKINLIDAKHLSVIMLDGFGLRVKGIHIISPSKLIDILVKMVKQTVNEKIANRIFVHNTIQSVYEYVPKEILPVDYGGKERAFGDIFADWIDTLASQEFREILRELKGACTDESLRRENVFSEHYLGIPGTFRSLNLD